MRIDPYPEPQAWDEYPAKDKKGRPLPQEKHNPAPPGKVAYRGKERRAKRGQKRAG